jgi:hypothetical protein
MEESLPSEPTTVWENVKVVLWPRHHLVLCGPPRSPPFLPLTVLPPAYPYRPWILTLRDCKCHSKHLVAHAAPAFTVFWFV